MAFTLNFIKKMTGQDIVVVANYSALPDPTTVSGKFYWVSNAQGTSWLPGSVGGTYYNSGLYYSNGTSWEFINVPYQATQAESEAPADATLASTLNNDKFITPRGLFWFWRKRFTDLVDGFTLSNILGSLTIKGTSTIEGGSGFELTVEDSGVNATREWVTAQKDEFVLFSKGDGNWGSTTGFTTEQVLRVLDVPANQIGAGDTMILVVRLNKDIATGNILLKIKMGVNGNTSDTTICYATVATGGNSFNILMKRNSITFTGSNVIAASNTQSLANDITAGSFGSFITTALNTSLPWKITITAQTDSLTPVIVLKNYYFKIIKQK